MLNSLYVYFIGEENQLQMVDYFVHINGSVIGIGTERQ